MTLAISQESEQLLRLAQERSKQSIDSILHEAIMRYLEDIEDEQARENPNQTHPQRALMGLRSERG